MSQLNLPAFGVALVLLFSVESASCQVGGDPKGNAQMEVTGTLRHPVFAIGGETTGTVVETKKGAYELDLRGEKDLLKLVESLKGKQVTATGTLRIVKGVEIPERRIIALTAIKEAKIGTGPKEKDK